ncbi:MAG TPA: RHS repeat-associated core domain-containing protein [Thermoanaerobaculia bacterium]|nr:RHS repeat-associated core domain-containing protein [Thermoanaerobaculia bacterium]
MIDDVDAFAAQLLATCRCQREMYAEVGFEGMMIRATAAKARLLSHDPRVLRVEEVPVGNAWEGSIAPPATGRADVEPVRAMESTAIAASAMASVQPVTEANAAPWDSGLYRYDGAGNISGIGAKKYVYDGVGRLRSGGESTAGHRQEYTYDRNGNLSTIRTFKPGFSPELRTLTVNPATNQVTTFSRPGMTTQADYDLAGRMRTSPDGTFKYDAGDMITESQMGTVRAVHLYTASDERIATIGITASNIELGSDWTIRDLSGKVLRRFKRPSPSAQWRWDEDYIYRDGQLLAAEVWSQERTLHFHPDHIGTPRLITGNGGAKVSSRELHPFGEEFTVPDNERMKFTGHERDSAALDYMHARYYTPTWGRFLSVDPVLDQAKALKEPQRWNRYSYVINNPLRYKDPDGRQMKPTCDIEKCPPPPVETVLRLTPQNIERMAKNNAASTTPTMRSASNGTPPTPGAFTVSVGVTASFVAIGGGSVNASLMRTVNRIGPEHSAVAATGGVHTASLRASIGLQGTVGLFRGIPSDQRGATTETNFTLGRGVGVGVSLVFSKAGGFLGGSLSYGLSEGAGMSASESGTAVLTGQDVLNKLGIDP